MTKAISVNRVTNEYIYSEFVADNYQTLTQLLNDYLLNDEKQHSKLKSEFEKIHRAYSRSIIMLFEKMANGTLTEEELRIAAKALKICGVLLRCWPAQHPIVQ